MTSTPLLSLLEKFLDVTSARHALVVENMANVDTPAYHTRDIDFRAELRRAVGDPTGTLAPAGYSVPGLLERPDGNNVSLDREGLALAETQIQYRIGVSLLQNEFHQILSAINEGNKG